MTRKLFRSDDHEQRCTSIGRGGEGQCYNLSIAGMLTEGHIDAEDYPYVDLSKIDVCPRHGANKKIEAQRKKTLNNYKLEKFKEVFSGKLESANVKDLSDEIILLRISMQAIVNVCEKQEDILMYTSRLTSLAQRLESMIMSMDKLEQRSGQLMDKAKAMNIAARMLEIISRALPEDQKHLLEDASDQIIDMIKET